MDLVSLLHSIGYLGIWAIIFAETGILFGLLLPGDTLLFAAGVLAGQGHFNIWIMVTGCFTAALTGNLVGYWLGETLGLPFIRKYCKKFITDDHLEKTHELFEKHGNTGIIIARFLPVARTVAPFLAGVIQMDYKDFVKYSILGAFVWAVGLPLLGYYIGHLLPDGAIDMLLIPILLFIIAIIAFPYIRARFRNTKK